MPTNLPSEEEFARWADNINKSSWQIRELTKFELWDFEDYLCRARKEERMELLESGSISNIVIEKFYSMKGHCVEVLKNNLKNSTLPKLKQDKVKSRIDELNLLVFSDLVKNILYHVFRKEVSVCYIPEELEDIISPMYEVEVNTYSLILHREYEAEMTEMINISFPPKQKKDCLRDFYKKAVQDFNNTYKPELIFNSGEKDICKSKITETAPIFVYSMVKLFSDYLELNISPSQYKYATHGGRHIAEKIYTKIPEDDIKGDKPTITDLATELYRNVYHDRKVAIWDLHNGKKRFNQKFKGVIELHPDKLKKIEDCIIEHKLEIIASYKK